MSKPANKTLIGIFVLGAIALAVVAVVVLGSGKFFKPTMKFVMFFDGSVKGLSIGAPVIFRGVKVGSVSEIRMAIDPKDLSIYIPVYVEIGGEVKIEGVGEDKGLVEVLRARTKRSEVMKKFIDQGLRAQLDMQSFVTGQLQIALDFDPKKKAKFVGKDPQIIEIPTEPTVLQEFLKKVENLPIEEIVQNANSAIKGIDHLVNSPELMQTVRSISQAAQEAGRLVHNVNAKAGPVLSGIEGAVGDARHLIQNVDGKVGPVVSDAQKLLRNLDEKVTTLTSRIDETLKDAQTLVRNVNGEVGPVSSSLKNTLASIQKASDEAGVTLQQAQQVLKSVEGGGESELIYEVEQTLRSVRSLANSVRDLVNTLEQHPESAVFGRKKSKNQ